MKKLLFICTGNFYRSRYAEAFFNYKRGSELADWNACSRGLMADCAPTSLAHQTKAAIKTHGIPASCYQKIPIQLQAEDLESADLVIALKREEHFPMMKRQFPDWADRIRYWDVHDLDVWESNQTLPAIEIHVGLLIAELGARS